MAFFLTAQSSCDSSYISMTAYKSERISYTTNSQPTPPKSLRLMWNKYNLGTEELVSLRKWGGGAKFEKGEEKKKNVLRKIACQFVIQERAAGTDVFSILRIWWVSTALCNENERNEKRKRVQIWTKKGGSMRSWRVSLTLLPCNRSKGGGDKKRKIRRNA